MLKKHQQLMYVFALFGASVGLYYLYNHVESVPITGRKRLMMLSQNHLQELGNISYIAKENVDCRNFYSMEDLKISFGYHS